jgi:hypothetical protein
VSRSRAAQTFPQTTNGGHERLATGRRLQLADREDRREIAWRRFKTDAVEGRTCVARNRRCGNRRRPAFRGPRQCRGGDGRSQAGGSGPVRRRRRGAICRIDRKANRIAQDRPGGIAQFRGVEAGGRHHRFQRAPIGADFFAISGQDIEGVLQPGGRSQAGRYPVYDRQPRSPAGGIEPSRHRRRPRIAQANIGAVDDAAEIRRQLAEGCRSIDVRPTDRGR